MPAHAGIVYTLGKGIVAKAVALSLSIIQKITSMNANQAYFELVTPVLPMVCSALAHASTKHPKWPPDLLRQIVVISEEIGELQKAALSLVEALEREDMSSNKVEEIYKLNDAIDHEAAQAAAMLIRFLSARKGNI